MVARDLADVNFMMDKLRARKMDFEEEEDVAGFLGVHIERTPEHAKLTQKVRQYVIAIRGRFST